MAILDDDFGRETPSGASLKLWRKRKAYSALAVVVATAWGLLIPSSVGRIRALGLDVAFTFYVGMALLLLAYIGWLFSYIESKSAWALVSFVWFVVFFGGVNVITVLIVDVFNLGRGTLPILCFFSASFITLSLLYGLKRYKQ